MGSLLRLLGLIAAANLWLRRWSLNGLTFEKWLLVVLTIAGLLSGLIAIKNRLPVAILVFSAIVPVYLLLVTVARRHNIIFSRRDESEGAPQLVDATEGDAPLLASGKFTLWEGDRTQFARFMDRLMSGTRPIRWLNQVPVQLAVSGEPTNAFAFTTFLDLSQRFLGLALENKSGMWMVTGTLQSLETPEAGQLSMGLRDMPALRLRFLDQNGKRCTIVLASESQATLDEVLAKLYA